MKRLEKGKTKSGELQQHSFKEACVFSAMDSFILTPALNAGDYVSVRLSLKNI